MLPCEIFKNWKNGTTWLTCFKQCYWYHAVAIWYKLMTKAYCSSCHLYCCISLAEVHHVLKSAVHTVLLLVKYCIYAAVYMVWKIIHAYFCHGHWPMFISVMYTRLHLFLALMLICFHTWHVHSPMLILGMDTHLLWFLAWTLIYSFWHGCFIYSHFWHEYSSTLFPDMGASSALISQTWFFSVLKRNSAFLLTRIRFFFIWSVFKKK